MYKIEIDDFLSLPQAVVQSAVDVLADWFDLVVTVEQCTEIIASNKFLAADLYTSMSAGDTSTRELLIDAVVEKLLGKGRSWPLNMMPVHEAQKFHEEFAAAARGAGYKIGAGR